MADWQPIETAPKDGDLFLAYYVSDHGPKVGSMSWVLIHEYFYSWTTLTETHKATHWMPLPEAPHD